jgi:hypothetical protein
MLKISYATQGPRSMQAHGPEDKNSVEVTLPL